MTTKGGGRTTIQCRSDGWVEVIVLISRQHGYDSQQASASSLSLPIMSAFLWNPQDVTRSSLMWPWPVRMVSWKRLTRWCRRRLIHLHNQNKHPHPSIWAGAFAPLLKKDITAPGSSSTRSLCTPFLAMENISSIFFSILTLRGQCVLWASCMGSDYFQMLTFSVFMNAWYGLEAESTREDDKIQDDVCLFLVVEDQNR